MLNDLNDDSLVKASIDRIPSLALLLAQMKHNKIFRTLAIALALSLLIVARPATPALAVGFVSAYPASGPVGTPVTVTGLGFTASSFVEIYFPDVYTLKTTAATDTAGSFVSPTFIIGTYPAGSKTVYVKDLYTWSWSTGTFTITPQIDLDETSGYVGDEIKVSGTGFAASQSVIIYLDSEEAGSTETNSAGSFTNATFTVPESYRGSHIIKAQDISSNYDTGSFTTNHSITMGPTSGVVGTEVTVSGTGFKTEEDITITFAGGEVTTSPASVTTNSKGSFSASFNVPAGASVTHEVEASDGTNTDSGDFTISAVANISQTTGYVGDEVTFSGTGFQASQPITITFDNESIATAATDNYGSFNAIFTVPARSAGTYQVKVNDGTNTVEADFSISTSVNIEPITNTAAPGHVGTEITISGVGFIAGRTVTITYDGNQITTTNVNTDGTFSAAFQAPASSGGDHSITATDATNTKQFTFTMESTPPSTVYPKLPLLGSKIEEWKFDWGGDETDLSQEVTDDSLPITYTLQIATDENFSPASIVIEKTGLTQSEYTVPREQRLESVSKETPYYWRVKAIDSASNEGQWTGTGSFYVGFSWGLSQTVIYILFSIGALVLGLFGFWLGRKTAYY